MKKKILFSVLVALIAVISIFAVSCSSEEKVVLNVYNWGEYMDEDVNDKFEEYYKKTYGKNVEVNYMMFDSNESMYNKIKTGAVAYDVIIPSDYMIERMIAEGMLEELNMANIPCLNEENIYSEYINPDYDKKENNGGKKYSAPYFAGVVGIIYNTKYVAAEDVAAQSWDILWNEKYKGKILQFNNARDAFGTALLRRGIDVNTTSEADWRVALADLQAQKPLVKAYVMDEIFNQMESGSAWIAPYYAGDFLTMREANEDLEFYYPREGTNIFEDAMCIPKGAENKEVAEAYINFMLMPENCKANSEYVYYATPNKLVNEDPEYQDYMNDIYPSATKILDRRQLEIPVQYYENMDDKTLQMINSLWEELKIENSSSGVGVYVTCGVIVFGIAAFFTVRAVRKKVRKKYY